MRWTVSVNVSARNLESAGFADQVLQLVSDAGADPRELIIELTETAPSADNDTATAAIRTLNAAGVTVSLDDFGTGATGLLQLRRLAVREIKIDRVFVADLTRNPDDRNLVRSVVDLGHSLGCRVVAEGVEEQGGADWLRSVGCDEAQGYLYQRPVPWFDLLPASTRPSTAAVPTRPAPMREAIAT
jgi:EAL domain-containing protein (putative c-di-GMP-specific phosphodiesterase class I)